MSLTKPTLKYFVIVLAAAENLSAQKLKTLCKNNIRNESENTFIGFLLNFTGYFRLSWMWHREAVRTDVDHRKNGSACEVMTSREAAEYLRISYDGFRTMRSRGQGPAVFIAIGRRLRFRKQDLDAFLASHVQRNTSVPDIDNSAAADQHGLAVRRKRGRPRATGQIVVMPVFVYVRAAALLALAADVYLVSFSLF